MKIKQGTWCILLIIVARSCHSQSKSTDPILNSIENTITDASSKQIAEYIRNIYEDKFGGLWFGTNGLGVAHYDGEKVNYYSIPERFYGEQITGISEDQDKNIWFSTNQGIVQCLWDNEDSKSFTFKNYPSMVHFGNQNFWSILVDSENKVWAGAAAGIYVFNGLFWDEFVLPLDEKTEGHFISKSTSWSILEDSNKNIWISTNGYGVFKFNGKDFTNYTEKDGLSDNSVDVIIEDKNGDMWFGTRFGGINKLTDSSIHHFDSNKDIAMSEVCSMYEDKKGNIWFSAEGYGVFKYDGKSFTNYGTNKGLKVKAPQVIFEDSQNRFWVGGGGGLYRLENDHFINVTTDGPWK